MPEWSNGPHSKCGERVTVPRVRIPIFPLIGLDETGQQTDKSHKFNGLWGFFYALWRGRQTSFRHKMTGFVTHLVPPTEKTGKGVHEVPKWRSVVRIWRCCLKLINN